MIGCSKKVAGAESTHAWCEEVTSKIEISKWLKRRFNFQHIFPSYSQIKPDIDDVDAAAAEEDLANAIKPKRPPNKSDLESTELTELLGTRLGQPYLFSC